MRTSRSVRRSAFAAAVLSAALPLPVLAGSGNLITVTTHVDNLDAFDQHCSLREAVLNANTNTQFSPVVNECAAGSGAQTDVIVLSANTTYTLTLVGADAEAGDLDITDDPQLPAGIPDVHLLGTSIDGVPIIVQSVAGERVLEIVQADVVMNDLIVREGSTGASGGGILNQGGELLLRHVGVHDNTAASGGGIYSTGPLTLDTSALSGNSAIVLGGGVFQDGATLAIDAGFIGLNQATVGGGVYGDGATVNVTSNAWFAGNTTTSDGGAIMNAADSSLSVEQAKFTDNTAGGHGGAIRSLSAVNVAIIDAEFVGNTAVNGGAVHSVGSSADILITRSRFEGNTATGSGGAIASAYPRAIDSHFHANTAALEGGAVLAATLFTTRDTLFTANAAQYGGAVYAQMLTAERARFEQNSATDDGGAVLVWHTLKMNDSQLTGNTAGGDGGGLWLDEHTPNDSFVLRSLVAGNVAQGDGGGLWTAGEGEFVLANSTVSGNGATGGSGSGLYIDGGLLVKAINTTLADNSPGENVAKYGTLQMQNSIISTPGGIDCVVALEDPLIVSLGHNLSDDDTCLGLDAIGDQTGVDVLLAPLAYTSSTMRTHALLPGSPALDAGNITACEAAPISGIDQRGGARNIGVGCDIGAHEQGAVVSMMLFGDGFE